MKIKLNRKNIIFLVAILLVVLAALWWFLGRRNNQTATIDDLPVWELSDGTTVYREMEIGKGSLTVSLVVQSPASAKEGTKIYQTIPKEIAASAKDLKFSVEPEIVQDDPVVLWSTCKTNCPKEQGFLDMTKTLATGIAMTIRDVGLNYLTNTCSTEVAKKWIKDAGYKEGEFFGCSQYMRYLEKEVAMRQTAEWQNKLEQGKIKNTYEPTDSQYQTIQQSAKKQIQAQNKTTTTAAKKKNNATTTAAKKGDSCQYCSQIKCRDCKSGFDVCRSDKTGCTSCNTDADCLDTHFCSGGAGCFLKESEIHKRARETK